ncbi:sensor histidine kinase [Namhaeicola litoreus]|uniref:Sensor histidine kinase n=1 Tax=Namhaeicola litoreus TaxID=1052145 RepID=A0ABW3XYN6_9FLAO
MASIKNILFKQKNHNPYLFNGVIWITTFFVMLFAFSEDNHPKKIDFLYTSFFLITIIIPSLINLYIAIPNLLKKEKYILYAVVFLINLMLFTQLNIWFFDMVIDKIFPDYYFISYNSNLKLIVLFTLFLIGTTLLKIFEDWIFLNRRENEKLVIENQKIQSQLSSLRSQINPHFLFNALNVIYALALDKKEETTDAIVQLSDILRYVIYDSNTNRVMLKDEVKLINSYLEFQKFRLQKSKRIKFNANVENENYLIYPMLLLPLIENSFKYGSNDGLNKPFIKMDLKQINGSFSFCITNNYAISQGHENNNYSGVGIENIKKNLEIIYPDRHVFATEKNNNEFKVTLKLFSHDN